MSDNAMNANPTGGYVAIDGIVGCVSCPSNGPCTGQPIASAENAPAVKYRRGTRVTVRSLNEILATLDADSKCEGMPFMPEMVPYCGQTFHVYRRAEKTCVESGSVRGMSQTVFLDALRCDGSAHDGCQRGCLFFWKEAWLRPADDETAGQAACEQQHDETLAQLPTKHGDRYYCQSTELAGATHDLPSGKLRHYLNDLRLGEITLRRFAYLLWLSLANRVSRWFLGHDFLKILGNKEKTLHIELNLQPGEWVEVKNAEEIRATLDSNGCNRGLLFDTEMGMYCGQRHRVASLVRKIIRETTGEMVHLNNTVILEGLVCQGLRAKNCPRANYFYWREIWLKRVEI